LGFLKRAATADQENMTDDESVTAPEQISATLDEINRHLVLVRVRLDPDGPLYDSFLVRLDKQQKRFYLNALSPAEVPEQGLFAQSIDIFVSLRGIAIRFAVTIEDVLREKDRTLYVGPYPTEILYLQRRDIFRVHLPLYDRRNVVLRHEDSDARTSARILDMSVKGFCVELNQADIKESQIGSRFEYMDMELPAQRNSLSGEATLVNLRPSPKAGLVSAGFAITNMDPQSERALMRAALYYQREARKAGN